MQHTVNSFVIYTCTAPSNKPSSHTSHEKIPWNRTSRKCDFGKNGLSASSVILTPLRGSHDLHIRDHEKQRVRIWCLYKLILTSGVSEPSSGAGIQEQILCLLVGLGVCLFVYLPPPSFYSVAFQMKYNIPDDSTTKRLLEFLMLI